jgi:hypothetical protein
MKVITKTCTELDIYICICTKSFSPFENSLFLVIVANLDEARIYKLQFRMGTTQGLFLTCLICIGLVDSKEKTDMWKAKRRIMFHPEPAQIFTVRTYLGVLNDLFWVFSDLGPLVDF